jgi:transposase
LPKKKQTRPQKWSYRILFDAMLYQLKNGCHWAELPKDFPPYSSVYWHYKQWRALGTIDKLMSRLHESLREQKR